MSHKRKEKGANGGGGRKKETVAKPYESHLSGYKASKPVVHVTMADPSFADKPSCYAHRFSDLGRKSGGAAFTSLSLTKESICSSA